MQLTISTNSVDNPVTLDLTQYIDVVPGDGMDPANPSFTSKVISHSLLKQGGTLALENFQLRELVVPLKLNTAASPSAAVSLQSQINQIINTPGATASWEDDGLSQPTVFDLATGQFDIEYNYRAAQQGWLLGMLRLFAQPFGRIAAPRLFATASAVGPMLMISPYYALGGNIIGASTQASVAGYGGQQQPSGGVFYWGNPSLAGDAPALLQISYTGPVPPGASSLGIIPIVAVSVLPDRYYQPLINYSLVNIAPGIQVINDQHAVASSYFHVASPPGTFTFYPLEVDASFPIFPPVNWAGSHRLMAIARASQAAGTLTTLPTQMVPYQTTATVNPGDWQLVDLGVFQLRANQSAPPNQYAGAIAIQSGATPFIDVTAFVMLPDNTTWFLNPGQISPSGYGVPSQGLYTGSILIDDFIGDQFVANTPSMAGARPVASLAGQTDRVTQYSRGLVPQPDPRNGVPVIAILSVGQPFLASTSYYPGASWANPQNSMVSAQVNVIDRARYVLP